MPIIGPRQGPSIGRSDHLVDYGKDARAAIQAALDAIPNASHVYTGRYDGPPETRLTGGGEVLLPRPQGDIIVLNAPIVISGYKSIRLAAMCRQGVRFRMAAGAGDIAIRVTSGWAALEVYGIVFDGCGVSFEGNRGSKEFIGCLWDRSPIGLLAIGNITNVTLWSPIFQHCVTAIKAVTPNNDYWRLHNPQFVRGKGIDIIYGGHTLDINGGTVQMHETPSAARLPNIQFLPGANMCWIDKLQFSHDASADVFATPARTRILFGDLTPSLDTTDIVSNIMITNSVFKSQVPGTVSPNTGDVDHVIKANCRAVACAITGNFIDRHHSYLVQENHTGTNYDNIWDNRVSENQKWTFPGEEGIFSAGGIGWNEQDNQK